MLASAPGSQARLGSAEIRLTYHGNGILRDDTPHFMWRRRVDNRSHGQGYGLAGLSGTAGVTLTLLPIQSVPGAAPRPSRAGLDQPSHTRAGVDRFTYRVSRTELKCRRRLARMHGDRGE